MNEILKLIKNPEELLDYMKNIDYGYLGQNNHIYKPCDSNFGNDWRNQNILQSPTQLVKTLVGNCWDQVELERKWFSMNNYVFKTYYFYFDLENIGDYMYHTFLVFENNNKYYLFENSFEFFRGIHKYGSLKALMRDMKDAQMKYLKEKTNIDYNYEKYIAYFEYKKPKYGLIANEFLKHLKQYEKKSKRVMNL